MTLDAITCPSCGASRFSHDAEGTLICAHCGMSFGNPQTPIDCPACHTVNPPNALKCMTCGLMLGRICPVCNHHNPPNADHCLQCATPLDNLSKVIMRSDDGKAFSNRMMKDELVRTKGDDMMYMVQERERLDVEERERVRVLREQQAVAIRQQRAIMTFALLATVAACVMVAVVLMWR